MTKSRIKIDVIDEPELQYAATPELFEEIRAWLLKRGGIHRKTQSDVSSYYDTTNFRLLREGGEYRVKEKVKDNRTRFDHDMKIPCDPHQRAVVPDENDILWRKEIKMKEGPKKPELRLLFGQGVLDPIVKRVYNFFDKELECKFIAHFEKNKIDHDTLCGNGRVEYSFQTGHMQTPDGKRKTQIYHILELELRDGTPESLLEEKAALEAEFFPKGLKILPERKVILGMALLVPDMTPKQLHAFNDARARNLSNAIEDAPRLAA